MGSTSLPSTLISAAEHARSAVEESGTGELSLSGRIELWHAIGPRVEEGDRRAHVASLCRAHLAVAAVEHVLPLWDEEEAAPAELIARTKLYLANTSDDVDEHALRDAADRMWTEVDDMSGGTEMAVGYGACCAARVAVFDESFELSVGASELRDEDHDPYDWDAALYASIAFTGSAPWEGASSPERRREFWFWYLDKALPRAWRMASAAVAALGAKKQAPPPILRYVRHAKFGRGAVRREIRDGGAEKLEIEFAAGTKILLASAVTEDDPSHG